MSDIPGDSSYYMGVLVWLTAENSWLQQQQKQRLEDVQETADAAWNLACQIDDDRTRQHWTNQQFRKDTD